MYTFGTGWHSRRLRIERVQVNYGSADHYFRQLYDTLLHLPDAALKHNQEDCTLPFESRIPRRWQKRTSESVLTVQKEERLSSAKHVRRQEIGGNCVGGHRVLLTVVDGIERPYKEHNV